MRTRLLTTAACFALALHASAGMIKVLSVVNGNTLHVTNRGVEMDLRLMGVATPDPNDAARPILKQLGTEAVEYLRESTRSGWVYVEFPAGEGAGADSVIDAAVYGGHDSAMLNEKLVAEGFGIVNRKSRSPMNAQLLKAEAIAKASHRGIWGNFADGSGSRVASGEAHQPKYVGQTGLEGHRSAPDYVTFWVITFY